MKKTFKEITVIMALTLLTSACKKNEEEPPIVEPSQAGNSTAKSTAVGYSEYAVAPQVAVKGTNFFFKVVMYAGANSNMPLGVKFIPPIGSPVTVAMSYNAATNSYTLSRSLTLYNDYQYQYVFYRTNSPLSGTAHSLTVLHSPIALGNDYPYANSIADRGDKWDFFTRNCTSWVAWKVNQMWGTDKAFHNKMKGKLLGHATTWKSVLTSMGYRADNTARAGDIAYWAGAPAHPDYGHVAFVNSVDASGNITITEYNTSPYAYGTRVIKVGSSWYPNSFIHVQNQL